MAITSIQRDQNNISIVRMSSSDDIATISSANYILFQQATIDELNEGGWEWLKSDFVFCAASDSNGLFQFTDDTFHTLVQYGSAGSGTVNPGLANQLAYYAANGSAVSGLSTPITLAQGGTNANLTANDGGVFISNASAAEITDSAIGGVFVSDSSGVPFFLANPSSGSNALLSQNGNNPIWSANTYPAATSANELLYTSSNFHITGLASVNSATLITSNLGVPHWSSSMTNGQLLIGSTGSTPALGSITAGGGGTVLNGASSISISPLIFINVDVTTQITIPHNQNVVYIINLSYGNNANLLLPDNSVAPTGQIIKVISNTGGWVLHQNTVLGSQRIRYAGSESTSGPTGGIQSSGNTFGFSDCVELIYALDDVSYIVSNVAGNPTLF